MATEKPTMTNPTDQSVAPTDPSVVRYRHSTVKPEDQRDRVYPLKMPPLGELLAAEFPDRLFLMSPWLREHESCMVYAATGLGKSLFALSAALAIAGAGEFLGWRPNKRPDGKPWRVLYVDGEMHISDIKERARTLRAGMADLNREEVDRNLFFLARQHQEGGVQFPSITAHAGQSFVLDQVKQKQIDLIILDNFSTLGEVEDENAAASFNAIQQFLLQLKMQEVATILVHHTGKAEDNFRGSSKLSATFETIIQLERPVTFMRRLANGTLRPVREGSTDHSAARFRVKWDKLRAGSVPVREVVATLVQAGIQQDDQGGLIAHKWESEAGALGTLDEMREQLEAGAFKSQKEIAAYFDKSATTARDWINKGILLGLWTEDQISRWLALGQRRRNENKTEEPVRPDANWRNEGLTEDGEEGRGEDKSAF